MTMKIGICGEVADAALIERAGADFVEVGVQTFLMPQGSEEDFSENLAAASAAPLPVIAANRFLPGELAVVGESVNLSRIMLYAKNAFRRAGAAGVEAIVFGSGAARRIPDGFPRERALEQFIECTKDMGSLAAEYGVVLVIEPLNAGETNLVNSLAEGAAVVEALAHPSVQLLADVFHMTRGGESPDRIMKYGTMLRHVHIAEKEKRTPPGVVGDDFLPYLKALKSVGYPGPISIECRWDDLETQATDAVKSLRGQLAAAGY